MADFPAENEIDFMVPPNDAIDAPLDDYQENPDYFPPDTINEDAGDAFDYQDNIDFFNRENANIPMSVTNMYAPNISSFMTPATYYLGWSPFIFHRRRPVIRPGAGGRDRIRPDVYGRDGRPHAGYNNGCCRKPDMVRSTSNFRQFHSEAPLHRSTQAYKGCSCGKC